MLMYLLIDLDPKGILEVATKVNTPIGLFAVAIVCVFMLFYAIVPIIKVIRGRQQVSMLRWLLTSIFLICIIGTGAGLWAFSKTLKRVPEVNLVGKWIGDYYKVPSTEDDKIMFEIKAPPDSAGTVMVDMSHQDNEGRLVHDDTIPWKYSDGELVNPDESSGRFRLSVSPKIMSGEVLNQKKGFSAFVKLVKE